VREGEGEGKARAEEYSIVPKRFVLELVPAGPHAMNGGAQTDQGASEEEMGEGEIVALKKTGELGFLSWVHFHSLLLG
jgi:hypothetical protein